MTQNEIAGIIHKLDNMDDKIDALGYEVGQLAISTAKNTMVANAVTWVAGSSFVATLGVFAYWLKDKVA